MSDDRSTVVGANRWFRVAEEQQRELAERLRGGGGGGTSDGVTDYWREHVDRQLQQLHVDVRALLNRGVAAAVVLAAMIAGLYLYTNEKFERLNQRIGAVEVQQAATNGKIDALDARLNGKLDLLIERKTAGK